jgi:hypothetical protein
MMTSLAALSSTELQCAFRLLSFLIITIFLFVFALHLLDWNKNAYQHQVWFEFIRVPYEKLGAKG